MIVKLVKMIEENDWSELVSKTYSRPYSLLEQREFRERGAYLVRIEKLEYNEKYDNFPDNIPEVLYGSNTGIKFHLWLARDPNAPIGDKDDARSKEIFWKESFYPCCSEVANDMCCKGLIEPGEYYIRIDW